MKKTNRIPAKKTNKIIEELHAEAQSNLAALRASQKHAYYFMICVVLIASALIICSLI